MATSEAPTGSEYIAHHLRHLASSPQHGLFDRGVVHVDTLFFSLLTGLITIVFLFLVALDLRVCGLMQRVLLLVRVFLASARVGRRLGLRCRCLENFSGG